MKKRLVFGLSAILSILSTVTVGAVGDNCVKNGDFESGSDNFGICYSSRTDTKMPSISFSDEFFNDGNGALEILPGQTLEEKESNSTMSDGFAYQGIYCKETFLLKENVKYTVSADVYAKHNNIKARILVFDGSKLKKTSEEFIVAADTWNRIAFDVVPDANMSNARVRVVFYDIVEGKSIFVDNVACIVPVISNDIWQPINSEQIDIQGMNMSFEADNDSGIYCESGLAKYNDGEDYALVGTVSTTAPTVALSLSCPSLGGVHSDYVIKNGENVKIVLPFNISEITGERIRFEIKAVTDSGTVNLNDVKVVNIKEVIIVEQIDNTLKISGKLRAGNENKEIAVDISDIGTQTVNTNINGEYSYTVTVSEVSGASKKLTVTLSGIVNYPEYNNVLCAEYKFSNPGYLDEIAAEVDDCTTAEAVKTVLTDDVLIDTGIVAIPVFISANRSEVYNYLSKADITDGIDLLSEIKTAGALSSLNIKSQDLTDMIDEYGALLGTDTVKAHVDNYSNASKETLDNMFKASNVKITDKQSFSYALTEVLVRHEINKKTTYAEQMDLLMTYADDLKLDFSEYNKLSSNKQYNVATKLTNNIKNVTDYSILQSKLDEYVVEAKKSVESGGNSNTSGGSSSGGSGISVAVKPVSNNKTEETVQKYKFTDINNYAWAEESIYALLDKGVISKAEDKKFNPGNNITRAEFAKMAAVLFGYKLNGTETVFVDVTDNNWYFDYVMALYQNGIVNGITENQFGSNEFITRQDICVILQRIIKEEQASDVSFTDIDEAADYAKGAIYVMKGLSILEGYEDGSFRPKNYATRAEIAKILYKISQ